VNSLVFATDPGARLFGSAGPDGAQDARSGDGHTVYQAKFHGSRNASRALADARAELKKIKAYKKTGHRYAPIWEHVENWVLVTNAYVDAAFDAKWQDSVVPPFKTIGLTATYWSASHLDGLLADYPEVEACFFGGKNRVFLSLGEAFEVIRGQESNQGGIDVEIVGRKEEMREVFSFLVGEKRILSVHGSGGVGKTRFLFEVGRRASGGWRVFWANVSTMASTPDWFFNIVAERKTLLLIDDPIEARTIDTLLEQMRGPNSRAGLWKAIIVTRSSDDSAIVNLWDAKQRSVVDAKPIELPPLQEADSKWLVNKLFRRAGLKIPTPHVRERLVEQLSRQFGGFPVWIAIAISLMKKERNLKSFLDNAESTARSYLKAAIEHTPSVLGPHDKINSTVRHLALFGPVNIQNDRLLRFIGGRAGVAPEELLKIWDNLAERRFVNARGLDARLREIKPDVIRDYVLRKWLAQPNDPTNPGAGRRASRDARALMRDVLDAEKGLSGDDLKMAVKAAAGVELREHQTGQEIRLLDDFVETMKFLARGGDTKEQKYAVEFTKLFAAARVADVVEIVRAIRLNPKTPHSESLAILPDWPPIVTTHEALVRELAPLLFQCRRYISRESEYEQLIGELKALVVYTEELLPTDVIERDVKQARSAAGLLEHILSGEYEYPYMFPESDVRESKRQIESLKKMGAVTTAETLIAMAILKPLLSLTYDGFKVDGETGYREYSRVSYLHAKAARLRDELRDGLRAAAQDAAFPAANRIVAWRLLAHSFESLDGLRYQTHESDRTERVQIEKDLEGDLRWLVEELEHRVQTMPWPELVAAWDVWRRHPRDKRRDAVSDLQEKCEALASQRKWYKIARDLFGGWRENEIVELARDAATELLRDDCLEEYLSFTTAGTEFYKRQGTPRHFYFLALELGSRFYKKKGLTAFVLGTVVRGEIGNQLAFAAEIVKEWIADERRKQKGAGVESFLTPFLAQCRDDNTRRYLISTVFLNLQPESMPWLGAADLEFISRYSRMFVSDAQDDNWFRYAGELFWTDWRQFEMAVASTWASIPLERRWWAFANLVEGIDHALIFAGDRNIRMMATLFEWLMDLAWQIPDMGRLTGLDHIIEKWAGIVGPLTPLWALKATESRIIIFKQLSRGERFSLRCSYAPDAAFVQKIVRPVASDDPDNQGISSAFDRLLCAAAWDYEVAHSLKHFFGMIDTHGIVTPAKILGYINLEFADYQEEVSRWVEFAPVYEENSEPWRKIALAACQLAQDFTGGEKRQVYSDLKPDRGAEWSTEADITRRWKKEMQFIEDSARNEGAGALHAYWDWRRQYVDADLHVHKGLHDEWSDR
jgi:hypothetical protein